MAETRQTLRLRADAFHPVAVAHGWTHPDGQINASAVARAVGVQTSTVTRLLRGERNAGELFAIKLLRVVGEQWRGQLFEPVPGVDSEHAA